MLILAPCLFPRKWLTDGVGTEKKKTRIRLRLPKQPWTGIQAQKQPAMLSPSSLSRPCGSKELVQLRWLKAIWALGGHSPDQHTGPCPSCSPLWALTLSGLPCTRVLHDLITLSQGSQENKLLPRFVLKYKGFLSIRTGGHSSRSPSFSDLSHLLSDNSEKKGEEARRKGKSHGHTCAGLGPGPLKEARGAPCGMKRGEGGVRVGWALLVVF